MRVVRGVLMLMWLLAALPAAAQEVKPEEKKVETKQVDPVVVTATTVATPATQLGVALSVVTEDDFKTYHYATVDEALRNLPGVEIRRSGSLGKISNISIRGANANQVQVLVDGVRVKSPTLGQVDLSDLSPDLIDRIEIGVQHEPGDLAVDWTNRLLDHERPVHKKEVNSHHSHSAGYR